MHAIPIRTIPNNKALPKYVEVALPIPLRQTFSYSVPDGMREEIKIGARLLVPFGNRHLTGYAVALDERLNDELGIDESAVKEIHTLEDTEPLLTNEIIDLTRWAAGYYASSWGEMLKASLPAGINPAVEKVLELTPAGKTKLASSGRKDTLQLRVLKYLSESGCTPVKDLRGEFGGAQTSRIRKVLLTNAYVAESDRQVARKVIPKIRKAVRLSDDFGSISKTFRLTEKQRPIIEFLKNQTEAVLLSDLTKIENISASSVKTLAKHGLVSIYSTELLRSPLPDFQPRAPHNLTLTDEQCAVFSKIENAVNSGKYRGFLLHGVTGSGKTEVYIRAMKAAVKKGKSSLMLVPEIALTPVFSKRLRSVFGKEVAILHSSLSAGERFDEWRRIRNGDARVVIGTRSAVFAPLIDIGLIVIDEEHDTSYRQHEMPFYNGRDVAIVRANNANAVVILGSATPALESFHNSRIGKYEYLSLPNRIENRPLATAELIDMREVFDKAGKDPVLAPDLIDAIEETHSRGEQSIILLNRRGFSQFVLCRSCGEGIRCRNCDITLTYHKREHSLICHYCGFQTTAPTKCPSCESGFLYFMGEGTEQIEDMLRGRFPELEIARVDRDTAKKRNGLERVFSDFGKGKLDLLIGTQMIAKGHDFHNVTLVGVISVDAGLSMPDFRSAERTFQLLTQVAGRAGRGSLPGRVLIQTYHPEHYALKHAKTQSYDSFYKEEIAFRKRMHYPPFVALASIMVRHPNYNYAFGNAKILKDSLDAANTGGHCIVLGPAVAPLSRLRGEHRIQILVKSKNRVSLRETIEIASADAQSKSCDMKIVYLEIDPVNLL